MNELDGQTSSNAERLVKAEGEVHLLQKQKEHLLKRLQEQGFSQFEAEERTLKAIQISLREQIRKPLFDKGVHAERDFENFAKTHRAINTETSEEVELKSPTKPN